jgi:aryl carrier-like protein
MTEAECYIGEVWCEVLELEHVGVDDNFFALGGHSIHAMQVIARLQSALGLELSLAEFFAAPTIAAIAPLVELAVAKEYPA